MFYYRYDRGRTGRPKLYIQESTMVQSAPKVDPSVRGRILQWLDLGERNGIQAIFPVAILIHGEHKTKNRTYYTKESCLGDPGRMSGSYSLTWPYPKPIIREHRLGRAGLFGSEEGSPIYGRIIHGWTGQESGSPLVYGLFRITHPEAIRMVLAAEFYTLSIGVDVAQASCSICGRSIITAPCPEHERGQLYGGKEALWRIEDWHLVECSFVSCPSDALAEDGPARIQDPDIGLARAQVLLLTKEGWIDMEHPTVGGSLWLTERAWPGAVATFGPGPADMSGRQSIYPRKEDKTMNEDQVQALLDGLTLDEWARLPDEIRSRVAAYLAEHPDHPAAQWLELDSPGNGSSDDEGELDQPLTYGELYQLPEDDPDYKAEAVLTTRQRKRLPDSAFCGPNRTWPVPDCQHVGTARAFLANPMRTKNLSAAQKARIRACVERKAKQMGCDKEREHWDPSCYALILTHAESGQRVPLFDLVADPSQLLASLWQLERMNLPIPIKTDAQKRILLQLHSLEIHCDLPGVEVSLEDGLPDPPELELDESNWPLVLSMIGPLVAVYEALLEERLSKPSLESQTLSEELKEQVQQRDQQLAEAREARQLAEQHIQTLKGQVQGLQEQVQQLKERATQLELTIQEERQRGQSELVGFLLWHSQHPRARGKELSQVQAEMQRQHPAVLDFLKEDLLSAYLDGRSVLGPIPEAEDLSLKAGQDEQTAGPAVPDPRNQYESLVDYYRSQVESVEPEEDSGDRVPEHIRSIFSLFPR